MFLFCLVFEAGVGFRVGVGVVIGGGQVFEAGVGSRVGVAVTTGILLGGALGLLTMFCVFGVSPGNSIDIFSLEPLCADSVGGDNFGILLVIVVSSARLSGFGSGTS